MKYYVTGYTPPAGINDAAGVAAVQRQLNAIGANLAVDGVWGEKTQAAYQAATGGGTAQSAIPSDYRAYLEELQAMLAAPAATATGSDEAYLAELQAALRPAYDAAIAQRKQQTDENRAMIDVDAASRGMGASTWVTDAKDRQEQYEAEDIAALEAQYGAAYAGALLEARVSRDELRYKYDALNAGTWADTQQLAIKLAGEFYSQATSGKSGGSSRGSGSGSGNAGKTDSAATLINMFADQNPGFAYLALGEIEKPLLGVYTQRAYDEAREYFKKSYGIMFTHSGRDS